MTASTGTVPSDRAGWLAVLARAPTEALAEGWSATRSAPAMQILRQPEIGLVMVRGRMGGVGRRFNLGEMTVTRCAVTAEGLVGHGYVQGRDKRKAELVARFDLLMQLPGHRPDVERRLVEPLAAAERHRREGVARKAAATRVEFFTLVRGED